MDINKDSTVIYQRARKNTKKLLNLFYKNSHKNVQTPSLPMNIAIT